MSFKLDFRASLEGDTEIKRKFEDLEKTLQDVKRAAEDSSKPLEDTAKAMDDLGKSAGDVDKDLDDTSKALDDLSKSTGDIGKDLDDVSKSFDDISKSAVDVSTDLKDADSAFSDIASNADGAVSSMDAVKSSFDGISDSAVEADQNIAAATTGLEGVGTATESAAAGADSLASSLDNIAASAQEAETNISAAANGIDGIGTSIGQAETALDGLGSAFDGAGTSTTTFNDVLSSTGTQAQAASGGLTPLNTVLGQVGGATQQAQGGFQGFNSSLGIMTGFIGTAASGAIQFVSALNNLHGAQIKVEATQVKLSGAIEAEGKARAKLNDLLSSGTATTEQIAQAELDLEQAHAKTAIASERAGKAQDDLNIKYAKFATDVLPSVIQTVTSTIGAASQLKGAFGDIGKGEIVTGLEAVGGAAAIAVAGFKGLETAIKAIEGIQAQFNNQSEETVKKQKEVLEAGKSSSVGGYIDLIDKLFGVSKGLDESLPKAKELDAANKASAASAQTTAQAFDVQSGSTKAMGSEMGLTGENVNKLNELMGKSPEVVEKLSTAANTATTSLQNVKTPIEDIKASLEGGRAAIDSYEQGVKTQIESSETLKVKLHEQNEAMTENINQTMQLVGSSENYNQALLTIGQSIADHQVKIDQLNASLGTAEGQQLSFTNAILAGEEKFLTWVQTTQDAAVEAATFKGKLDEMANTFGGLPAWIEPTVENLQAFIRGNKEGGDAAKEFARISLESYRSLVDGAKPLFDDLKEAWGKVRAGIWEEGEAEGELIDPVLEAFKKLPPAVAATLDEVELKALSFSAEFAAVGEEAGTGWANNLKAHIDMGETFDQALAAANQAALDIITPFVQEHPETAQMIQPLLQALESGTPQAVKEALESLAGMQGPFQKQAQGMLQEWNTMTGELGPSMKTGVEGAIGDLSVVMQEGFNKVVQAINQMLNNDIKQTTKPAVDVDKSLLDISMGNIQTGIDSIRQTTTPKIGVDTADGVKNIDDLSTKVANFGQSFLESRYGGGVGGPATAGAAKTVKIGVDTTDANTAVDDLKTKIDGLAGKNVLITVDTGPAGIAIQGLQTQLDGMAGKNVTITVDTGAAGIAITGLQGQIDGVVGKNVTITVDTGAAGIAITGLQGQIDGVVGKNVTITVDTGAAGLAITGLQGNIDGVHGKNVAITVDTGAAGLAITEIQGQIDGVHGTNVYITVDTSGAQTAITQLQNQINSLQQSMGGIGGGYTPGYQSPYGSYQGAYGSPYGYAQGFGPAVVNEPTRMLVGEAGPELVSVIPMKGRNRKNPPRSLTAAAGMGWYGPASGGLGYGAVPRTYNLQQLSQILARDQGQMQQGAQQGTQEGMQQSQPGMEQAVQQGAQQGVQDGMQQGGGGGGGYPMAPSNTEIWGAGRFTWGGGASGTQLGGGNMGGAQYPTAGVPLGPEHAIGFGSRPIKYTWGGGRSGTTLTPTGPHVGAGLPGPDPYAFGGGGASRGVLGQSYGGSTMGAGYRMPGYEGTSDAEYERRLLAERDRVAQERGTSMGSGASKNFVKAFDAGVEGQSQLINGVPATILSGNGGPARQAGNEAGTAAGQGFAQGFNDQMGSINTSAITQGQAGYPKVYTGEVPASYGKPLGQLINGIAATILPGQGPRGPPMQAAFGMHRKLSRDTLIQAHRNERVDISPNANAADTTAKSNEYANAAIDRITNLLEKLLSQGNTFKVDFNVDGRKLSSVAAKHMGTTGYGDK